MNRFYNKSTCFGDSIPPLEKVKMKGPQCNHEWSVLTAEVVARGINSRRMYSHQCPKCYTKC